MQYSLTHECPSQPNAELRTWCWIIGSLGDVGKGLHESLTSHNSESKDETMAHTQLIKLDLLEGMNTKYCSSLTPPDFSTQLPKLHFLSDWTPRRFPSTFTRLKSNVAALFNLDSNLGFLIRHLLTKFQSWRRDIVKCTSNRGTNHSGREQPGISLYCLNFVRLRFVRLHFVSIFWHGSNFLPGTIACLLGQIRFYDLRHT